MKISFLLLSSLVFFTTLMAEPLYLATVGSGVNYILRFGEGELDHSREIGAVFGANSRYVAAISAGTSQGKELIVWDYQTGQELKRHPISLPYKVTLSGLSDELVFSEDGSSIYFVGYQNGSKKDRWVMSQVNMESGEVKSFVIPQDIKNPKLFTLPTGVGVYSMNGDGLAAYSQENGEFTTITPEGFSQVTNPTAQATEGVLQSSYVYINQVGIVRVGSTGEIEKVTDDKLKGISAAVTKLEQGYIRHAFRVHFGDKDVILCGRSKGKTTPLTSFSIIDPETTKILREVNLSFETMNLVPSMTGERVIFVGSDFQIRYWDLAKNTFVDGPNIQSQFNKFPQVAIPIIR